MKLITLAEKISTDDKSDFHEGATLADIVAFEIGKFCTGGNPILCKSGSEKIYIFDPETNKIDDDDVQDGLFAFMESWREFFNEISED